MFGEPTKASILKTVRKGLDNIKMEYEVNDSGNIVLTAMGDDLPIGMVIINDDENKSLNFYCHLMFDIPSHAKEMILPELNKLNTLVNNGTFMLVEDETITRILFKLVLGYYGSKVTPKQVTHLAMLALGTVDRHDAALKSKIPDDAVRSGKDVMFL